MVRARRPRGFARFPIRVRLTIAFSGVMAAVFAAASVFLYAELERDLDGEVDQALHTQVGDAAALVRARGRPAEVTASAERAAQVYEPGGRVVASTSEAAAARLLTRADVARAARATVAIERREVPAGDVRIRAAPVRLANGRTLVVAVGDSLSLRDDALRRVRTLLLIAGPLALLMATVAGYELAGAALRPVDRMRARAEQITDRELSERLPVSPSGDEIEALGRTLNAMLDRVEAAVARERRLVSEASHELRTPLTTLRAEVDLALRGERDPEELRAALESAAEEAERMTRLADDLLVLARADEGRLPLHSEPIAVQELLDAAATRARAAALAQARTVVVCDETGDGERVLADADRAAQALENLVTNALRYGEGTVTLEGRRDAELVELHVTDEGGGFDRELITRAFERFGRGEEARASGTGSGLGLAIVEAVAVAHGGRVGARNRPEGGADVWIALPRA